MYAGTNNKEATLHFAHTERKEGDGQFDQEMTRKIKQMHLAILLVENPTKFNYPPQKSPPPPSHAP